MSGGESVQLMAGQTLAIAGDQVVALTRGRVEVWCGERLLDIVEPPRWFHLARALAGADLPAVSLRACGAAEVSRWSASRLLESAERDPKLQAELCLALARECVRHEREAEAALRRADDFFEPGAELHPPAYEFGPFPCVQLVVEHAGEPWADRLPPGLVPLPGAGGRYLVMINDVRRARCEHVAGREWAYREVVPFIPVLCPSRMTAGLFTPEVFADATMPILLGREVYGFPKRLGRIAIEDRFVRLLADHALALELRFTGMQPTSGARALETMAKALVPALPSLAVDLAARSFEALDLELASLPTRAFMRKRIHDPRGRAGLRWAIDELVEVPFVLDRLAAPQRLDGAELELGRAWPLGPGRLIAAFACEVGFRLDHARRVRDYVRGRDV